MHAASFKDLLVYKKAMAVANNVFLLSKKFPREETFALTDQVRRSSRSIGAQIAEAWGKRRYEKHFLSKLSDADGEHLNFAPRKFGAGQGGEGDGVFIYMEPLPTLPRAKNLSAIVGRRWIARPAADEHWRFRILCSRNHMGDGS